MDDDPATKWKSATTNSGEYVQVDLGGIATLHRVRIDWADNYAANYRVDISSDGSNWTTLQSLVGDGGVDDVNNLSDAARYVKIVCLTPLSGAAFYAINDVQVFNTPQPYYMPLERYEQKVAAYLQANYPDKSIADIPYDGPIIARSFDAAFLNSGSTMPAEYSVLSYPAVPANYSHRARITLKDANGAVLLTKDLSMPADGIKTFVLAYDLQGTNYTPKFLLDGVAQTTTSSVASGTNVTLLTDFYDPGAATGGTPSRTHTYTLAAGLPIGLGLGAGQISDAWLQGKQSAMNDEAVALANATTDTDKAAYRNDYQNLLLGYAAMRYYHEDDQQRSIAAGLLGMIAGQEFVESGLMEGTATLSTSDRFDLQYPVFASSFSTDNPLGNPAAYFGAQSTDVMSADYLAASALIGAGGSAWEHNVIEQITNSESVSTWRGFEMALRQGTPILSFTHGTANVAAQLNLTAAQEQSIQNDLNAGFDVTVARDQVRVGSWYGAVWRKVKASSSGYVAGYMISGPDGYAHGGAGGGVIGSYVPYIPPAVYPATSGDPVNLFNGNLIHNEQDIAIPNTGVPLVFNRYYNSLSTDDIGMGPGWSFTYSDHLDIATDKVTWTTAEGYQHVFKKSGSTYTTPKELFGRLDSDAGGYTYSEKDGTAYRFDANGKLTEVRGLNGNKLLLTYGGNQLSSVYDSQIASRKLTFTWGGNGKLASVSDFTGRTWNYSYVVHATVYSLQTVTGPADATTTATITGYAYTWSIPNIPERSASARDGLLKTVIDTRDGAVTTFDYYPNRKIFRVTDAEGNQEYHSYDFLHLQSEYWNNNGDLSQSRFNLDGQQTVEVQSDQSAITSRWNGYLLQSRTDELGRTESYVYDSAGNVTSYTAKDGVQTTYVYGATLNSLEYNQRTKAAAPGSRNSYSAYDTNGNLIRSEVLTARLNTSSATASSNTSGHAADQAIDSGTGTYWESNGAGTQWLQVDLGTSTDVGAVIIAWGANFASGYSLQISDDATFATYTTVQQFGANNVKVAFSGTGAASATKEHSALVGKGRYLRLVCTAGSATYRVADLAVYANSVTTMGYDSRGRMTSTIAPKGNVAVPDGNYTTTYTYNDAGQILTAMPAGSAQTSYTYDLRGNRLTETDQNLITTSHTYDLYGRELTTILPAPKTGDANPTIRYGYLGGSLISVSDAMGNITQTTYDQTNRPVVTVNADDSRTIVVYDALGNLSRSFDELGRQTKFIYDSRGRVVETILADGASTHAQYDGAGRVTRMTDELGYSTTSVYDAGDRIVRQDDPLGDESRFTYNNTGELIQQDTYYVVPAGSSGDVNGDGIADTVTMDNGLTLACLGGSSLIYTRDLAGRVTQTRGPAGLVTTSDYDANGSIINQTRYDVTGLGTIPADPRTLADNLKRPVVTYYDTLNRVVRVVNPDGTDTHTSYDAVGRVQDGTDGNGNITHYDYDRLGRLITVTAPDPDGTGPLTSPVTSYQYDANGNVIEVTDPNGNAAYPAGDTNHYFSTRYKYDSRGRRTFEISADPDGSVSDDIAATRYVYDAAGNVTQVSVGIWSESTGNLLAGSERTTSYGYDARNRKTKETLPDADGAGTEYAPQVTQYGYDAAGRLVQTTDNRGMRSFVDYDPLGRVINTWSALPVATATGISMTVNGTTMLATGDGDFAEPRSVGEQLGADQRDERGQYRQQRDGEGGGQSR